MELWTEGMWVKRRLGGWGSTTSIYIFQVGGHLASQVVPRGRECQRVGWWSACTRAWWGQSGPRVQRLFDLPTFSANKSRVRSFLAVAGAGKGLALCPWVGPRNAQRDVSMWMMDHGWQSRVQRFRRKSGTVPHVAFSPGAEISREVFLVPPSGRRWRVVIGG
jgi:hypothetical protein